MSTLPVRAVDRTAPAAYLAVVAAIAVLFVAVNDPYPTYRSSALSSLVIVALCALALMVRWGRDPLRGPLLYLILFSLFHFSAVWALAVRGEEAVVEISYTALAWTRDAFLHDATHLASFGVIVFTAVAVRMGGRAVIESIETVHPRIETRFNTDRLGRIGAALQLAGLSIVLLTVYQAGGLGLLVNGYLAFLEAAQSESLGYGIWAIGLGSCLTQVGSARVRRLGLVAFVTFAAVMFPLGLRGSVLFPAAALLAVRAVLGRTARLIPLAAGSIVVLGLAAFVRQSRVGAGTATAWYDAPLSTVTELGFSLRPTVEVLRWHESGMPSSHFVSFFAVPLRVAEGLTGGSPPAIDERLFNVKVMRYAGPIGGSPVAEGYDAWRWWGVAIVLALIAYAVSAIMRRAATSGTWLGIYPVVLLPLLTAVRNSFAPLVIHVALGLIVVALGRRSPQVMPSAAAAKEPRLAA